MNGSDTGKSSNYKSCCTLHDNGTDWTISFLIENDQIINFLFSSKVKSKPGAKSPQVPADVAEAVEFYREEIKPFLESLGFPDEYTEDRWECFLPPTDDFDQINWNDLGVDQPDLSKVEDQTCWASWASVYPEIKRRLQNRIMVEIRDEEYLVWRKNGGTTGGPSLWYSIIVPPGYDWDLSDTGDMDGRLGVEDSYAKYKFPTLGDFKSTIC